MLTANNSSKVISWCAVALMVLALGCSQAPAPATDSGDVQQIPAGSEYSGFLGDYDQLSPDEEVEGAYSYVNDEEMKDLHMYVNMIVEPVKIYIASDTDPNTIPDAGRQAAARYFEHALRYELIDAFRMVEEPGPATLRLRAAIVGVDSAGAAEPGEMPEGVEALEQAIDISSVIIEVELVDSETGERIAAAVDKEDLGEGARLDTSRVAKVEKAADAKAAFDMWAARIRDFLDAAHELKGEDAELADEAYQPYR
jgi:uncharacterized protein DUF3313